MDRVLLCVDLSFQTYRAAATRQNLTNAEGVFTGGLYGFLVTLAAIIRETRATHVVVCRDVRPYRRSLEYPEYKMLRKKAQDPVLKEQVDLSMKQVLAACEVIGLPVLGIPGFEFDDIAAHFATHLRNRFTTIYAASNDSDLFQLFWSPNFRVYHKDMASVMDLEHLRKTTGLDPDEFMLASALQGTHNDIAGIEGVGEKTAYKAVKDPGVLRKYRERHADLIDRNLRLIRLPHADFPREVELPKARTFYHRDLYRFCAQYDIEVTINMINSFEQVCP